ncbi:MAG TPA: hypothetical protein VF816_02760 [Rhodocyclaceae bacterium]
MCPKLSEGEIDSMKSIMRAVLNGLVMDVFGLDPEVVLPSLSLYRDLRMSAEQRARLATLVAEYFDGQQLEIGPGTTLGDVYAQVVDG